MCVCVCVYVCIYIMYIEQEINIQAKNTTKSRFQIIFNYSEIRERDEIWVMFPSRRKTTTTKQPFFGGRVSLVWTSRNDDS